MRRMGGEKKNDECPNGHRGTKMRQEVETHGGPVVSEGSAKSVKITNSAAKKLALS